jgi:hypothetical protein
MVALLFATILSVTIINTPVRLNANLVFIPTAGIVFAIGFFLYRVYRT